MTARPFRLAVVSDAIYPYHRGGKELRYHELLGRLAAGGMMVEVCTMHWWDGEAPAGAVTLRAICPRIALYAHGRRRILQGVVFALSTLRLLAGPRPSIIEADHMPYIQLFTLRLVAWTRRVPLVVTWHEVWGTAYWREYLGPIGGTFGAAIERLAARLPDHIVAVGDGTAVRLKGLGVPADRVSVIRAGVRVDEIASIEADPDAPEILAIGRLISHKRFDLALDAFARLRVAGVNVRLGIIGDGPERKHLELKARELGLGEHVRFYGGVADDRAVWALLRGARVLAAPSEREGFGLAVAESLSVGTPAVVAAHADNEARLLVDEGVTGSLIEPGDAGALAVALARWVEGEPDRAGIASHFAARHPELSWDKAVEHYLGLLHRLAA